MSGFLAVGFSDPVFQAQACFRAALQALARPGTVHTLGAGPGALTLGGAMTHLLLSLTDTDTPVWWQRPDTTLQDWLRFHTGAPVASDPGAAHFAVVTDPGQLAALDLFAQGSDAAPEFSTTVIAELPTFDAGQALSWSGPGILGSRTVHLAGLTPAFWSAWHAQSAQFPTGVDLIFCCGQQIMGLPRTTRIHSTGNC